MIRHYLFKKFKAAQNFGAGRGWASPNWWRQGLVLSHILKCSRSRRRMRKSSPTVERQVCKEESTTDKCHRLTLMPWVKVFNNSIWQATFQVRKQPLLDGRENGCWSLQMSQGLTNSKVMRVLSITSGCLMIQSYSLINPHNHWNKLIYNKHASSLRNMSASSERYLLSSTNVSHFYFQGHL